MKFQSVFVCVNSWPLLSRTTKLGSECFPCHRGSSTGIQLSHAAFYFFAPHFLDVEIIF